MGPVPFKLTDRGDFFLNDRFGGRESARSDLLAAPRREMVLVYKSPTSCMGPRVEVCETNPRTERARPVKSSDHEVLGDVLLYDSIGIRRLVDADDDNRELLLLAWWFVDKHYFSAFRVETSTTMTLALFESSMLIYKSPRRYRPC